jgi:hypothetical protein
MGLFVSSSLWSNGESSDRGVVRVLTWWDLAVVLEILLRTVGRLRIPWQVVCLCRCRIYMLGRL